MLPSTPSGKDSDNHDLGLDSPPLKLPDPCSFFPSLCEEKPKDPLEGCESRWHQGTYDSSRRSLVDHFGRHGKEVNATSAEQYLNKADQFSRNLRGATKSPVNGETPGVIRYSKNGKYIDIAPDGRVVSFGLK